MSLSNPELDMKWWNGHLANDKKYVDWAHKNIKLAQAIGHLTAAEQLRFKNPGGYVDAAHKAIDAISTAQKANKDKDLKAMLATFSEQAHKELEMAQLNKDHAAYDKQDQNTQDKMGANLKRANL